MQKPVKHGVEANGEDQEVALDIFLAYAATILLYKFHCMKLVSTRTSAKGEKR
jgi:hypothetical protein